MTALQPKSLIVFFIFTIIFCVITITFFAADHFIFNHQHGAISNILFISLLCVAGLLMVKVCTTYPKCIPMIGNLLYKIIMGTVLGIALAGILFFS